MNIVTIVYLLIGLVLFESSLTIYRLHRQTLLNRVCASMILLFAVFCFSYGLFATAQTREAAWTLSKISLILSCFMGSVILHFHLVLGGYGKLISKRGGVLLIYLPAVVLAARAFLAPFVIVDVVLTPWGWDNVTRGQDLWERSYLIYTLLSIAVGLIMALRGGLRTGDSIHRQQVLSLIRAGFVGFLMVVGLAANIFYGFNSSVHLRSLVVSLFTGISILFWLASLRYVMWKYKLFVLLPQSSSKGLFSGVMTPVLLVDDQNSILFANDEAKKIIFDGSQGKIDLTSVSMKSVVENYQAISDEITRICVGQAGRLNCTARFVGNTSKIYHLSIHPVRNERDVFLGNLILINPAPGFERLQQKYGLTAKEVEIVQLANKGLSAPKMAKLLGRSELTIKTHIHNIYQKTGVKNRVQLSQLVDQ